MNISKGKYKGIWEFPLTVFSDLEGPGVCKMPDFECKRYSMTFDVYSIFCRWMAKVNFLTIFSLGQLTVLRLFNSLSNNLCYLTPRELYLDFTSMLIGSGTRPICSKDFYCF